MAGFRGKHVRKGPLPLRYVLFLSLVFFLLFTVMGLWIIDKAIEPTLMSYAVTQTRKIAALAISNAISQKTINNGGANAIEIIPSTNGTPPIAKLNPDVINRIFADTTNQIEKNLTTAEAGDLASLQQLSDVKIETNAQKNSNGILWYVPIGRATNNALFGNLGPNIPVHFFAVGSVQPDVKTTFKPMGINNTWIEVDLKMIVSVQVILPFATKVTEIAENIPIGGTLIQGPVPSFYSSGGNALPSIQLPSTSTKK